MDKELREVHFFGKTLTVLCELWNMEPGETPDKVLWVERPEDMYGLGSPQLRDKKVLVVHREQWLQASRSAMWEKQGGF